MLDEMGVCVEGECYFARPVLIFLSQLIGKYLMCKRMALLISFLLTILVASPAFSKEPLSALQTIDNFYKKLLNYNYHKTPNAPRPKLKLSKLFSFEIEKNKEICKKFSTEICGWAADSDEYLDTQETDPILNYKNSGIKLKEVSPNTIEVKLNVYPSINDEKNYYNKTITFKMVKEGEDWVADDILYGEGGSSRENMKKENAYYISHPDPDSKDAKK